MAKEKQERLSRAMGVKPTCNECGERVAKWGDNCRPHGGPRTCPLHTGLGVPGGVAMCRACLEDDRNQARVREEAQSSANPGRPDQ